MSTTLSFLSTASKLPSPTLSSERPWPALALRVALVAGLITAMALAALAADQAAVSQVEPALARLLRGMAAIKACIAAVAVALALWRFGQAISPAAAGGYLVGVWSLGAATVLIWCLSAIPAAAALFHAGLLVLLCVAWRERR